MSPKPFVRHSGGPSVLRPDWRLPCLVLLCALLWGSAFPGIKYVYAQWETNTLSLRLIFAGIRFTIAGCLILPFCKQPMEELREAPFPLLFGFALAQTYGQYFFFYTGLAVSSGVLGALLVGTGSFWWMILAPRLLGSPSPTLKHWGVIAVSSLGIALAVYAPGVGSGSPVIGAACFLAATFVGALGAICVIPLAKTTNIATATAFSLTAGGVLLTLSGIMALDDLVQHLNIRLVMVTLYLAFVSAAAFSLWNWLVQIYSVNTLAGYRFLIPLCGVIESTILIESEVPGPGIFAGGSLIVLSLLWLSRTEFQRERSSTEGTQES